MQKKYSWLASEFKQTETQLKKQLKDVKQSEKQKAEEIDTQDRLIEELTKDVEEGNQDFTKLSQIIKELEQTIVQNEAQYKEELKIVIIKAEQQMQALREEHQKELKRRAQQEEVIERANKRVERVGLLVELKRLLKQKEHQNKELTKGVVAVEIKLERIIEENKQLKKEKLEYEVNLSQKKNTEAEYILLLEEEVKDLKEQMMVLKQTLVRCDEEREKQVRIAQVNLRKMQIMEKSMTIIGSSENRFSEETVAKVKNDRSLEKTPREIEDLLMDLAEEKHQLNEEVTRLKSELKDMRVLNQNHELFTSKFHTIPKDTKNETTQSVSNSEKALLSRTIFEMEVMTKQLSDEREKELEKQKELEETIQIQEQGMEELEQIVESQKDEISRLNAEAKTMKWKIEILEEEISIANEKKKNMSKKKRV